MAIDLNLIMAFQGPCFECLLGRWLRLSMRTWKAAQKDCRNHPFVIRPSKTNQTPKFEF